MKKWILGMDIGGTRTKLGLVDPVSVHVAVSSVFPTEKVDREEFFRRIVVETDQLCASIGIQRADIQGIGVGIGSYIFKEGGTVDSTWGYIPCLDKVALGKALSVRLGAPCIVDNDLRAIAMAESRIGAGKHYSRVLSITLGTGVGVCLTEDGQFVEKEAVTHLAGHIMVRGKEEWVEALDAEGCYCPIFGCMENTCSATALNKMAKEKVDPDIDNVQLFQQALAGKEKAVACLDFFFDCLARGLNQMIYLFSPDIIVLGGGITKSFGPYLNDLQQKLTAQVHSRQKTVLAVSPLEENSGILGAGLFMLVP